MIDVTDIKGIGPAKAETLAENGYDSVEALADADRDTLAAVDGVGEDRALEFIVGAEDLLESAEEVEEETEGDEFDLTPDEVGEELEAESQDDSEGGEVEDEEPVDESEGTEDESDEPESEPTYTVDISFSDEDEFHTFHAAIMRYHETVYTSNQPAADVMRDVLDGLDNRTSVSYELTEYGLNTLHTAVKQTRTNYQGDNLIDHMDALNAVEEQVNETRREKLF